MSIPSTTSVPGSKTLGSQSLSTALPPKGLSSTEKFALAEKEHGHKAETLNHLERAKLGLSYLANEPSLVRARLRARRLMLKFNATGPSDADPEDLKEGERPQGIGGSANDQEVPPDVMGKERRSIFAELIGAPVESLANVEVEPPFWCDYGTNIKLEGAFYCNFNTTILDCAQVTIGTGVLFGPNVHLYGATHSVSVTEREQGWERALPITIGRDCWIGGNVTIMGGVTIGPGCTIGACSTVTRDIPPYSVVAGTPAKVLKTLAPEERGQAWLEEHNKKEQQAEGDK